MSNFGNMGGVGGETGTTPERNAYNLMGSSLLMDRNANMSIGSRNDLFSPYMQQRGAKIQVPTPLRHNTGSVFQNGLGGYLPSFGGSGGGSSAQFGGAS